MLPLFHYELNPHGLLLLGSSESIDGVRDSLLDPGSQNRSCSSATGEPGMLPDLSRLPHEAGAEIRPPLRPARPGSVLPPAQLASISDVIQRLLVARLPTAVIVNDRGKVIYIHGRTGAYLEPAPGLPTHQVLDIAPDGLAA